MLHVRKEDNLTDRSRIRQQHDQPIDADAFTGGAC